MLLHGGPPSHGGPLKAQTSGREGALQVYVDASSLHASLSAEAAAEAAAAAAALEGEAADGVPPPLLRRRSSRQGSSGDGAGGLQRLAAGTSSIAEAEAGGHTLSPL